MEHFSIDFDVVAFLVVFIGVVASFVANRKDVKALQKDQDSQCRTLERLTQEVQKMQVSVAEIKTVLYPSKRPHERGST